MKISLILLATIFTLSIRTTNAQSPAPEPDTLKEIKQTDPEIKNIPDKKDANYIKDQVKITSQQVPAGVRRTLESNAQYKGWEKGSIFKNKAASVYMLELTKGDTTYTYQFDRSGKLIRD